MTKKVSDLVQIPLIGKYGLGKFAIVDADDFEKLIQYRWWARKHRGTFYAMARMNCRDVIMHRFILGDLCDGKIVDHINHDGLDNRKANIRPCTQKENSRNLRPRKKYIGVSFDRFRKKWASCIGVDGKTIHLGRFDDEKAAAIARDVATRKFFGELSTLNFPDLQE
jgi:hypothetical protein